MSKYLRDLLDAEEPTFTLALQQLERVSGKPAADIRLHAEIIEKSHERMKQLGLDPADTKGPELYNALINQVQKHDEHLAKQMGGKASDEPSKLIPLIKAAADKADVARSCWVLKKSVAKTFLIETPPKNIMKLLGYDDVKKMLKNEKLEEIYGALRFAEDGVWLNAFNEHYKRLTPADFTEREIEIVVMPERWADICEKFVKKKKHNITHLKEMGVILMLPIKQKHLPGLSTWVGSLLFHYTNEIRLYSTFFKMQRDKKDFGKIFVETLIADPDMGPIMAGQNVHWRVIQRYFGKLKNEVHPEVFQPHVQPEDLHWRRAEEALYLIDPELKFWEGLDYVGLNMDDGRPLTFNMMDVAASYTNNTPYEEREIYHFTEALWNETFMRYMGEGTLEQQILEQLDNDMIEPENLKVS